MWTPRCNAKSGSSSTSNRGEPRPWHEPPSPSANGRLARLRPGRPDRGRDSRTTPLPPSFKTSRTTCGIPCEPSPGSPARPRRADLHSGRGRRQQHHLQHRTELMLSAPTTRRPAQLVHIRMANGSHVSYRDWLALQESGALQGLAGYQFEAEVNWRGPQVDRSIRSSSRRLLRRAGRAGGDGRGSRQSKRTRIAPPRRGHQPRILAANTRRRSGLLGRTLRVTTARPTRARRASQGTARVPGYGLARKFTSPEPAADAGSGRAARRAVALVAGCTKGRA